MLLNLGITDIPYAEGGKSTGDVAEILEEKFHVMEIFSEKKGGEIAFLLADSLAGSIETVAMGGTVTDPFAGAMQKIEERFREFITLGEHGIHLKKMDAPKTGARFKRQYRKAKASTAFVDSGNYRRNFKSWVE